MMSLSPEICLRIAATAEANDQNTDWPDASWQALQESDASGWSISAKYGGTEVTADQFQNGMELVATNCLTTAFILSQREAAIRQLRKGPESIQQRYLPRLASGEIFMTVGLSQLTTSRQHVSPALKCVPVGGKAYQLDGEIPWVTGADHATAIVVGATLEDSRQILVAIPINRPGLEVASPLPLTALRASRTSLVRCREVVVEIDDIVFGPSENVMGKIGGGGLDTSCLALGLSAAAIQFIRHEAELRRELMSIVELFQRSLESSRSLLHQFAKITPDPDHVLSLRTECTKLALRASQAALMVAKGGGFIMPHPAQRWARQALFFLVWSCPRPVAEGVLSDLASL